MPVIVSLFNRVRLELTLNGTRIEGTRMSDTRLLPLKTLRQFAEINVVDPSVYSRCRAIALEEMQSERSDAYALIRLNLGMRERNAKIAGRLTIDKTCLTPTKGEAQALRGLSSRILRKVIDHVDATYKKYGLPHTPRRMYVSNG